MSLKSAIEAQLNRPTQSHQDKAQGAEKGKKVYKPSGNNDSLEGLLIRRTLDQLFYIRDHTDEKRAGLHASGIIKSDKDFCYREQVLSLLFEQTQGQLLPVNLLRIFAAGNSIHAKWQNLFVKSGIAVEIEARNFSEQYEMYFTPDAVIQLNNKKYVVEIKSVNTFQFQKSNNHSQGARQLQLYMHLLGIENGFVLAEDKNTQDWKPFITKYDYTQILPFLERLQEIQDFKKVFLETGELPPKKCKSCTMSKAQSCNLVNACFEIGEGRRPL